MNPNPTDSLKQLVACCAHKTGQGYKVRGFLYSLWNGQPYPLLEIVSLDSDLRACLLNVLEHFGQPTFFYDQIRDAFVTAGLFDWFTDTWQPSGSDPGPRDTHEIRPVREWHSEQDAVIEQLNEARTAILISTDQTSAALERLAAAIHALNLALEQPR